MDYSLDIPHYGWLLLINWDPVPGAEGYAIRVIGRNGLTPRAADGSPREQAKWKATPEHYVHKDTPESVSLCCLREDQRVTFRLRAIDLDNPDYVYGEKTAPFSFRLKQYGDAPVLQRTGVPTHVIFD